MYIFFLNAIMNFESLSSLFFISSISSFSLHTYKLTGKGRRTGRVMQIEVNIANNLLPPLPPSPPPPPPFSCTLCPSPFPPRVFSSLD